MPDAPPPLLHSAWLDFCREQWGTEPVRATYKSSTEAASQLDALLILNRFGQVCQPPLCPRLALHLTPSGPTPQAAARDWLSLAPEFARDLLRRGIHARVILPAGCMDARPLTAAGLRCGLSYTACLAFPYSIEQANAGARRASHKAKVAGYRVLCDAPAADLMICLDASAQRAGFRLPLTLAQLENAQRLLPKTLFKSYVCYDQSGRPAAGRGILCSTGHLALDWLTGTTTQDLSSGATQLLVEYILADLQASGASGLDFEGADILGVAESKLRWGATLTPLITVEQLNPRNLVRDAWRMFKLWRKGAP